MKEFKFTCPHCAQHLQAAESLAGRQFQCPGCNHLIHVPQPSNAARKPVRLESGHTWDTFLPRTDGK
jgi:hypothetical protein